MIFWRKGKPVYIVQYMRSEVSQRHFSKSYWRSMITASKYLEQYEIWTGNKLEGKDFDYKRVESLYNFLGSEYRLKKNTINAIIKKIVTCVNCMRDDGLNVGRGYEDYKLNDEEVTAISLSEDEIERIYNLPLRQEIGVIRDLFILSCETGLRYSDLVQIKQENINNDTLVRKTKKTGAIVIIPLRRRSREILKKRLPEYKGSQTNYNKVIKTICKRAGIVDKVLVEYTCGGKVVRRSVPRYTLVSSHTGRRTFATTAYLAGIPIVRIMLLTGHKTEEAFFRYIRISKKENATTLSEHPFFIN